MKEKLVPVIFGIISAAVWAATIALIVFSVVLLATGMERDPEFRLNASALTKAAPEDEAYKNGTIEGENWYKLTLDIDVSSAKYSPYSYTADDLTLSAGGFGADTVRCSVDAPLSFSKAQPDSFVLTVYVRWDGAAQELAERLCGCRFKLDGYKGRVAFFDVPFYSYPTLRLADFSALPGQLSEQAAKL